MTPLQTVTCDTERKDYVLQSPRSGQTGRKRYSEEHEYSVGGERHDMQARRAGEERQVDFTANFTLNNNINYPSMEHKRRKEGG